MPILKIDLNQAEKMNTPVRHLWPHVYKALTALPERVKQELLDTGVCLTVELVESPEFICQVEVKSQKMRISTGSLQLLWVCSYLNFMYYDKLHKAGGLTKSVVMDLAGDPELYKACLLFEWALNVAAGKISEAEWPAGLPHPLADPGRDSWEIFADDLTLEAVGYLFLHEMAHVALKHGPSSDSSWSIEQEKEADALAVQWIFQGELNSSNLHQIKRAIAIATLFLMQCAVALFTRKWDGGSHPPSWQRLDQVIRLIADDPDHPVFSFLGHLARMYRSLAWGPSGPAIYTDFLDSFDAMIEAFSKDHKEQTTKA